MRTVTEIEDYLKTLNWGSGMGENIIKFAPPCDAIYATPTKEFMLGPAIQAYKANLEALKELSKSRDTWNDCDKHAVRFWSFTRDCHAKTQIKLAEAGQPTEPGALSVGIFAYVNQHVWPREGHMACFALHETLNGLSCLFIEAVPERGLGELEMTEDEIASIRFRLY